MNASSPSRPKSSSLLRLLVQRLLPPFVAAACFVAAWEGAVRFWQIPSYLVPTPRAVLHRFVDDYPMLLTAWWLTAQAALAGLLLSLIVGTLIAVVFSQSSWLRYALYPYAIFLQTVPIVAIAPLLVMWLGYGRQGVIAVAFVLSIFPMIASVTAGMMSVAEPYRELFTLYRASRWQYLVKLQFPTALPFLATGLKTSSGLSVIGAIVGEFFVGYGDTGYGLGYQIRSSAESYQTASLFAAVALSTLLGIGVFACVSLVSERVLRRFGG